MAKRAPTAALTGTLSATADRQREPSPALPQMAEDRVKPALPATGEPTVPLPPKRRRDKTADKTAVFIRVTADSLTAVRALAEAEGLTIQDLGVYALNLALAKYGREPAVEGPDGHGSASRRNPNLA